MPNKDGRMHFAKFYAVKRQPRLLRYQETWRKLQHMRPETEAPMKTIRLQERSIDGQIGYREGILMCMSLLEERVSSHRFWFGSFRSECRRLIATMRLAAEAMPSVSPEGDDDNGKAR